MFKKIFEVMGGKRNQSDEQRTSDEQRKSVEALKRDVEREDQEFLEAFRLDTTTLRVTLYPFSNPEYFSLCLEGTDGKVHEMLIEKLFSRLNIDPINLQRVFEYKDGKFTGLFAPNGKQELATMLSKKITFGMRVKDEVGNVMGVRRDSMETYSPQAPKK